MSALSILEPDAVWRGGLADDRYVLNLSATHLDELDQALTTAESQTSDVLEISRADFPLPTLGPELQQLTDQLVDGPGVVLIRGLDVERYGKDRASKIYWGVGTHLGDPWPQNAKGHLLGDVTDQGRDYNDPTSRGNEIGGVPFPFHSDGSDLVGLFCLNAGESGGASLVANMVTIHNELAATEPELLAELYEPFPYDFRGEQKPGARKWYTMPVFTRRGERLFVRYIRPYIKSVTRHDDAPKLSELATKALDRVDEMCADPDYHVSMHLQPGEMQFVNNYHVLHARRGYTDDRPAGKIRHLKRLWLETDRLSNDDKPEVFRLQQTSSHWSKGGPTKSEIKIGDN